MNNILPIIQLNSSTFSQDIVTNPMRSIAVEIGDSKQSTFYPQFKTMHWNNDANFSMRLVTPLSGLLQNPIVTNLAGKISWQHGNIKAGIYAKDTGDEDGGYEFDVTLNSKPLTNILNFTIQSKNLDFFYQPALTADEIAKGVVCADNVIGSYAVYHNSKRDNLVGGMEYRTGKAFHIYRPFATDAKGQTTWCDLNIDTVSNTASITIPQTFLDTAMYPIVVDPTFGYTSSGAYSHAYRNFLGGFFPSPADGTISSISSFLYVGSGTYSYNFGIYNGITSIIETHIAHGSELTGISTSGLQTINVSGSITNGTSYWLVAEISTADNTGMYFDYASAGELQGNITYNTWVDNPTVSDGYASNQIMSIYATYTAVTPPTTNNTNFFFT